MSGTNNSNNSDGYSVFYTRCYAEEWIHFMKNSMIPKDLILDNGDKKFTHGEFDEKFVDKLTSNMISNFRIYKVTGIKKNYTGEEPINILYDVNTTHEEYVPWDSNYCLLRNKNYQKYRIKKTDKNGLDTGLYADVYEGGIADINKVLKLIGEPPIIEFDDISEEDILALLK